MQAGIILPAYTTYEDGQTKCCETSAYKIQMPGNHPKERIQQAFNSLTWINFNYSETTVTNKNCINIEIKRLLNSGTAFYHSVKNHLPSSFLYKNIKIKIHNTTILPVVLHGCEAWSATPRKEMW